VTKTIALISEGGGWKGKVKDNGQIKLSLEFHRADACAQSQGEMVMKAGQKNPFGPVFSSYRRIKPCLQKVDMVNVFRLPG